MNGPVKSRDRLAHAARFDPREIKRAVGEVVQSAASDARAAKEFADTEIILDRLDVNTTGGIRDVLDAIHTIVHHSPRDAC